MKNVYWVTGILGVLFIIAPFVLGYTGTPVALWTTVILGAAILIFSAIKAGIHDTADWEYWITGILGLAAVVAPFVLGFSTLVQAEWTSIILGVLVVLFSAYRLLFGHAPAK